MIIYLEEINRWFIANKLTMNTAKTKLCHFRPLISSPEIEPIHMGGDEIEIKDSVKYLGILIYIKYIIARLACLVPKTEPRLLPW